MTRISTAALICIAIGAAGLSAAASAGECARHIAKFERFLQEHPRFAGTAPQSIGAQLDHQPTPEFIAAAKKDARGDIVDVLAQARAFDAEGKQKQCEAAVRKAKLLANP